MEIGGSSIDDDSLLFHVLQASEKIFAQFNKFFAFSIFHCVKALIC